MSQYISTLLKGVTGCLVVLLLCTMPVFAQGQGSGEEHKPPSADEIVSRMQTKLNLTQDQVTAVTPIIEKYASKREDLRQSMEDGTADRDSIRAQMKELKTDENQELSQVLSSDQLSQWEQMMNKHRHNEADGTGSIGARDSGSGDAHNGDGGNNGT